MNPTVSRYQFSVCPHDTLKNSTGWFFLNTYLQRKLGIRMRMEPKDDFLQERSDVLSGEYHLVYANPFSALIFHEQLGFTPLAKPIGICDEALLVRSIYQTTAESAPRRVKIASATDQQITHCQGLSLLTALGIPLEACDFEYVGTHAKAAHAVILGKADFGFVYNETWNSLGQASRQVLQVVSQTQNQQACHCFCISPEWVDQRERVQAVLCEMKDDPKGKEILDDLQFPAGFEAVGNHALDAVRHLMRHNTQETAAP